MEENTGCQSKKLALKIFTPKNEKNVSLRRQR